MSITLTKETLVSSAVTASSWGNVSDSMYVIVCIWFEYMGSDGKKFWYLLTANLISSWRTIIFLPRTSLTLPYEPSPIQSPMRYRSPMSFGCFGLIISTNSPESIRWIGNGSSGSNNPKLKRMGKARLRIKARNSELLGLKLAQSQKRNKIGAQS